MNPNGDIFFCIWAFHFTHKSFWTKDSLSFFFSFSLTSLTFLLGSGPTKHFCLKQIFSSFLIFYFYPKFLSNFPFLLWFFLMLLLGPRILKHFRKHNFLWNHNIWTGKPNKFFCIFLLFASLLFFFFIFPTNNCDICIIFLLQDSLLNLFFHNYHHIINNSSIFFLSSLFATDSLSFLFSLHFSFWFFYWFCCTFFFSFSNLLISLPLSLLSPFFSRPKTEIIIGNYDEERQKHENKPFFSWIFHSRSPPRYKTQKKTFFFFLNSILHLKSLPFFVIIFLLQIKRKKAFKKHNQKKTQILSFWNDFS